MPLHLPLIRREDRKKIKAVFGREINKLLSGCAEIRRCQSNSFFIPNPSILQQCEEILYPHPLENRCRGYIKRSFRLPQGKHVKMSDAKHRRRERQRQRKRTRAQNSQVICPAELSTIHSPAPNDSNQGPDISEEAALLDPLPTNYFQLRGAEEDNNYRGGVRFGKSSRSPRFPLDHPLETPANPDVLFANIMKNCPAAAPCQDLLHPLLAEFILNHSNFKYFHIINSLTQNSPGQYHNQLIDKQLNRLFSLIVFKVPPGELFGHRGNVKRIRTGVLAHIKNPKRRYFIPESITNRLNFKTITWLQPIKDTQSQRLIVNQLIDWFIREYIIVIVNSFLASNRTPDSSERIFFPIMEARKQTDGLINNLLEEKILEREYSRKFNGIPVAILNVYLKSRGLRPVYQAFPDSEQQRIISTLLILIKQFSYTEFRSIKADDLHKVWQPFVNSVAVEKLPIFYVTCDVTNAFGRIRHSKLLEILDELFDKLPDNIEYQSYQCLRNTKSSYVTQQNFLHESLPFIIPRWSLFSRKANGGGSVPKYLLKQKLWEFIEDQLIVINEKSYRMKCGVGQGLSLSTVLSEIYYGKMMEEKFPMFQQLGTLVRYVDDFLYLTNHREAAELFLVVVDNGILDYNCKFQASKTHSNLPPICEKAFVFLSYKFNVETLEVLPVFPELPSKYNVDIEYAAQDKENIVFKQKMLAFGGLKLKRIVLDPRINSQMTILRTMSIITSYLAQRCLTLCCYFLHPEILEPAAVFRVVYQIIEKMMMIYYAKVSKDRDENKAIRLATWQAFVSVLSTNSILARRLVPLLQEKILILKRNIYKSKKKN